VTQQKTGAGVLSDGQGHTHLAQVWARPEPTRRDPGTGWGGSSPTPPSRPLSSLPSSRQRRRHSHGIAAVQRP